jgi:hypothetical protein
MDANERAPPPAENAPGGPGAAPAEAATPPTYIYALGRVHPRFPSVDLEKEFSQILGRSDSAGLMDLQAAHAVLSPSGRTGTWRASCAGQCPSRGWIPTC